jgi:hypothetical protein
MGCGLAILWLIALIGGFPEGLAPLERWLGVGVHLASLRPVATPSVYRLDAVFLLALPLGAIVWLAGNVGQRRLRGV